MNYMKTCSGLALGLATALLVPGAMADNFSGKTNAVCATVNVVACIDNGICLEGQAQTFDLPAFMFIDKEKNTVRTTDDSGHDASSPIKSKEVTEQSYILQGFENHRGWTLAIDRSDGSMNLSSTGPEVNFMISGNCTPL